MAANTVALTETTITGNQTHDVASDESQFLRPVRTGRAKALQSYVSLNHFPNPYTHRIQHIY